MCPVLIQCYDNPKSNIHYVLSLIFIPILSSFLTAFAIWGWSKRRSNYSPLSQDNLNEEERARQIEEIQRQAREARSRVNFPDASQNENRPSNPVLRRVNQMKENINESMSRLFNR